MTIQDIKNHGAMLGLEAELSRRVTNIKDAYDKRDWTWVRSHAVYIQELADELNKLQPKTQKGQNPNEPSTNHPHDSGT